MKHLQKLSLVSLTAILLAVSNLASAVIIELDSATAFQDEGTLSADHTAVLSTLDGNYGAELSGTVNQSYYATGTSPGFFDAISASFDLSGIGYDNVDSAELRFYVQKGAYATLDGTAGFSSLNNSWQHYQLLEDAFNPTNEDSSPFNAGIIDFGEGIEFAQNSVIGWVSASVDTAWITSNDFDITLRLWNARIDRIELAVTQVAVPSPSVFALTLLSLFALGYVKRTR